MNTPSTEALHLLKATLEQGARPSETETPDDRPIPIPSLDTAQRVSELLKECSGLNIKDLLPARREKLAPDVLAGLEIRTMQALILVLDAAIASVGRGKNFFISMVFDALASRWSATYVEEIARGPARWSRELSQKAGGAAWSDLRRNGLNFEALMKAAKNGYGLYTMEPDSRGFVVTMNYGTELWRKFEDIINDDGEYRFSREISRLRLVRADAEASSFDRKRLLPAADTAWDGAWGAYKVASGFAYDIAKPGPRKIRAMKTYERAKVYLDVATLVADVDELDARHPKILRADFPSKQAWQWARKKAGPAWLKTDGRLNSWRAIREQLKSINKDEHGQVAIRSNYTVVINGRFQNVDFWLPDVPSEYRASWFRMETRSGNRLPPVGQDISSSQLWVLAALLGDSQLEELLTRESFWKMAARRLWERHQDRLDGYTGRDDEKLVASCKSAMMTHLYGSPLGEVVKRLVKDPADFGPGLDKATIELLLADPELHLERILQWYLPACRKMTSVATKKSRTLGVTFLEPVDRALQRWNPLRTKECRVAGNKNVKIYGEVPAKQVPVKVVDPRTGKPVKAHDMNDMRKGDEFIGIYAGKREFAVPGHKPMIVTYWRNAHLRSADGLTELKLRGVTGHMYPELELEDGGYEVWPKELEKRIAPCIAHTMDADFCVNVTEALVSRGVTNIVPIHDSWYVPADDEAALQPSIEDAGEGFLKDLGPSIVDAFERYLGADKKYGSEVAKMRKRWDARVKAGKWPKFKSNPTK